VSDKIEPCPWCGTDKAKAFGPTGGGKHYVGCAYWMCLAQGPEARTPDAAISAWNEVAGLRAEVERLKAEAATQRAKSSEERGA
jgi:hypothetical protein